MKYPQLVSMPSEISDWLEEQLEARGIDAVVYTRYVLSLLHRDPVDVVCPDQDFHFLQPHREVRCSGSGRKHFRCFTGWRDHLQADAEKLKRTAAIECLMSASDQNCGIETLVDELCEKIKEIESKTSISSDLVTLTNRSDPQPISSQDLAQKYYAAFPPLTKHHRTSGTPTSIVTLIPKWFSSPKKKSLRRQNRSASFEEKLHYKVEADIMKPRFCAKQKSSYFSRSRNDLGYSRCMAKSVERSESMADWDLLMFSNNNRSNFPDNNSNQFANIAEEKVNTTEKQNRGLWSDEESMTICDDLPVDILDLLDSPGPQGYTVEMMNLANMRDGGNKNFIQCGTNITSSIWSVDAVIEDSVYDNNYNSTVNVDQSETLLGIKFKSLTVGNKSIESIWSNSDIAQNETNTMFENYRKSTLLPENTFNSLDSWEYSSGLEKFEKWSEAEYFDTEAYMSSVTKSLNKLNHTREESSFIEVLPKSGQLCSKPSNQIAIINNLENTHLPESAEKDDLLTSARSHFRPINAASDVNDVKSQGGYADGTSFAISGNLENPNYIRSSSGSQYLATDKGSPKKLLDYKARNGKLSKSALNLKFFVRQNDKACQTDDMIMDCEMDNSEVPCKKRVMSEQEEFFFPGDEDEANLFKCTCPKDSNKRYDVDSIFSFGDDMVTCQVHMVRPDSMLAEMWKGDSNKCDRCNKNTISWNHSESTESIWRLDKEPESIWNGGEICKTCINLNGGLLPRNSQLHEDISQDGEQLLSDLSTLQKTYYMDLPAAEISYDISELLTGNKERKRRHSPLYETNKNAIPVHRGSWSITSLMQVTAVPVLHSVTL